MSCQHLAQILHSHTLQHHWALRTGRAGSANNQTPRFPMPDQGNGMGVGTEVMQSLSLPLRVLTALGTEAPWGASAV